MAKHAKHKEHKPQVDQAVAEFADFAVEMLREGHHSELEPFEAYAARLRGEMIKQLEGYRERLAHGYEVLLKELAREKSTASQQPPPPGTIRL